MKRIYSLLMALCFFVGVSAQLTYTTISDFESGTTNASVLWSGAAAVVENTTGETAAGSKVLQVTDNAGWPFLNLPVSFESGKTWTDYDGIELDIYPLSSTSSSTTEGSKAVGLDLSLLQTYENAGVTYKDASGNTISDVMTWVKQKKGVNWVRLRLFVDPTSSYATVLAGGTSYKNQLGGDLATVKVLGKRVKDAGMNLLLDIHYSDGWADPAKQVMPYRWTSTCTTQAILQDSVYNYTKNVLTAMVNYGATPDMVQVGNEITYGMFFTSYGTPTGDYSTSLKYSTTAAGKKGINCFATYWSNGYSASSWTNLCNVIKKGCQAVREVCPNAKIMLHTERSTITDKCTATGYTQYYMAQMFYKKMEEHSVDYDVIGLSYYAEDHGTISTLNTVLTALEGSFPTKEIMLAEYGYSNNWWRGTSYTATGIGYYRKDNTSYSCALSQKEFISALITQLKTHSNVTGMFYWFAEENEADSKGPYGSAWRNSGLWANETTSYASNKTTTAYSQTKGCAGPAFDVLADFQDASSTTTTTKAPYYANTWLKFYDSAGAANWLEKKVGLNPDDQYGVNFSELDKWYTVRFAFQSDSISDYISSVGSAPTSINLELKNATNTSETDNNFLVDNIRFYKASNESYSLDFEDGVIGSASSAVHDGYCTGKQTVKANPSASGINTSSKVMTVDNTWVEGCDLYQWYVDLPTNLSNYDYIYMDVYPITSGTCWITCSIGGSDSWSGTWTQLYDGNTSTSMTVNAWNRLEIPLTALNDYTATRFYFGMWETGYSVDNITFHLKETTPTEYTITWDAATNGGTCATATTTVNGGDALGTLPEASKDEYTFDGWFTAASGGEQVTEATIPTASTTYYAQFTPNFCSTYLWFNGKTDRTNAGISANSTIFSNTLNTSNNKISGSVTIDGTTYQVTSRTSTGATACSFTIPTGYTGTFYMVAVSSGTATRTITVSKDGATATKTDQVVAGSKSEGTTIKIKNLEAGTYTITADGKNIGVGMLGLKMCPPGYVTPTYTITFKNDDGTVLQTLTDVEEWETPAYTGAPPTKAADAQYTYTFAGWTPEIAAATDDATYTATYTNTLNKYTVTFNLNGHGSAIASQSIDYGSKVTEPTAPTETGYTFGGWYKDEELKNAWNFSTDVVEAVTTLYAKWTVNTHKLEWVTDGNPLTGSYTHGDAIAYGTAIVAPATPTKIGYTFAAWDPAFTTGTTMPDNDLTYTATWTPNINTAYKVLHQQEQLDGSYAIVDTDNLTGTTAASVTPEVKTYTGFTAPATQTVSIAADGSTTVTYQYKRNSYTLTYYIDGVQDGDVETYKYEQSVTARTNPTKTGYTFSGWNGVPTTMPAENVEVTGSFTAKRFTLTTVASPAEGGTITGGGEYDYGTEILLTATGNTGYTFSQWSDGNKDNPRKIVVTEDASYIAEFTAVGYTITKEVEGEGSINGATGGNINDEIALTAVAAYGWEFVRWDDDSTNPERTITISGNVTVRAVFQRRTFTLTTKVNDALMGSVTAGGGYLYEAEVEITATPADHYHFVDWSDATEGATRTVQILSDTVITANFAIDQFTLTVSVNDNTMGSVIGSGTYNYGEKATLTATASEGYHFTGWEPASLGTDETIEVTIDGSITSITANFAINQYTVRFFVDGEQYGDAQTINHGSNATKPADPEKEGYTFTGWDTSLDNIKANTDINATFSLNTYTITWVDEDGTVLEIDEKVAYGTMPTFDDKEPTKQGNAQYSYTFAGWTPKIEKVTGDQTYTATYSTTTNKYTITFVNWNDEVLQADEWEYGETPEYTGEDPTRDEDANYTYRFKGWTPDIVSVTGEATYKAEFEATEKAGTGLESVVINGNQISGPKGMRVYDYTGKDVTSAKDNLYKGAYIIVVEGQAQKVMIP